MLQNELNLISYGGNLKVHALPFKSDNITLSFLMEISNLPYLGSLSYIHIFWLYPSHFVIVGKYPKHVIL